MLFIDKLIETFLQENCMQFQDYIYMKRSEAISGFDSNHITPQIELFPQAPSDKIVENSYHILNEKARN